MKTIPSTQKKSSDKIELQATVIDQFKYNIEQRDNLTFILWLSLDILQCIQYNVQTELV